MEENHLVLRGGRIIDPANNFDEIADIIIRYGKIHRISTTRIASSGANTVDLQGKWVIPGQIDTHAHVAGISRTVDPSLGYGMLAKAGTTTVVDMGGTGKNLIDGIKRNGAGLNVAGQFALIPGLTIPSDNPSRGEIASTVSDALRQGCIGVKMLGGYHPFSQETTSEIIRESNSQGAYVAFHVGSKDSGSHLGGLREIPEILGQGRLHICHVNSYCRGVVKDSVQECKEAIKLLSSLNGQINSEVYHAVQNGTNGACDKDGNVIANVPRNCLEARGFEPTIDGMREAIIDGYASVISVKGGEIAYIKGKEALGIYNKSKTMVGMSFPVNLPGSAFNLTTEKDSAGDFVVDAVSTDGGSHPRNVAIQTTMALVRFGALTPMEMSTKLSWTPSRMVGLLNKGHFSEGADADITVLDPHSGEPVMSFVDGDPVMVNGEVIGKGGRILVTAAAERTMSDSGVKYQVIDLAESKLYQNY